MVTLNIGYGAVKNLLKTICATQDVSYRELHIDLPAPTASIPWAASADSLEMCITSQLSPRTKFLLVDQITSNSALLLPIERISAVCAARGITVVVDGAHSLLNVPLDCASLRQAGVSYFITNAHKWFSSPKGVALLWVNPEFRSRIQPLVISHGSHHGFTSAFIWDGCHDYAPMLTIPLCIDIWNTIGVSRVREYMFKLGRDAAILLAASWQTAPLSTSLHTTMWLVELPSNCRNAATDTNSSTDAKVIQDYLYRQYIECPIKCLNGRLYVRISAHIYNTIHDYELLRDAILKFVK